MASVATLPAAAAAGKEKHRARRFLFVPGCTVLALLLLGYHPAAEDGGIYAAATAARLQAELFPAERAFAIAQSGRSLFVPLLAWLVRVLHLPLDVVLLVVFVASIAATLAAAQLLAREMFPTEWGQQGAVLLFAVALGLPVAGTSLYLADPYLTARSLSTPLLLLALALLLRGRTSAVVLCLAGAVAVHPIMAVCALPLFALVAAVRARSAFGAAAFSFVLPLCMAAVCWLGSTDSPAERVASLTRLYWFPRSWAAYEWLGAVAPPLLLLLLRSKVQRTFTRNGRDLLLGSAGAALLVFGCTCCLVHMDSRSLLLARLQSLRIFHLLYCVFLLALGGSLAALGRTRKRWAFAAASLIAGSGLLLMQRTLYAHSGHMELPGTAPRNGYVQAFLWVRNNTPANALFALDAEYTRAAGEDTQLFRAVALRSALPDAAKDGGIASMMPTLAPEWLRASSAQTGLADLPDAERLQRVRPLGASWIVLPAGSKTAFACPYRNAVAQVCRLP